MPKSLDDLFLHMLKDVYHAEKQVNRALPRIAKQVGDEELRAAIDKALELTHANVERIEGVFEAIDKPKKAIPCEAMQGIIAELEEAAEDSEGDVLDAGVLAAVQTINHYQMVRYGTLRAWGEQAGYKATVDLLKQSAEQSRALDKELSRLAEAKINASADHEEKGGEAVDADEGETVELEATKPVAKSRAKAPAKPAATKAPAKPRGRTSK